MDIKLILLDLDGTLLNSDKALSDVNRRALEGAAAQGVHIVPASGRVWGGMPEAVRSLPFVPYAVGANGAQVYDVTANQVIHRAEIPLDLAQKVYDYLDTLPVIYDCYLDGNGYIDRRHYERIDEFITVPAINRMAKTIRQPVEDFRGFITAQGRSLQKMQMFFRDSDMDRREQELTALARMFPQLAVTSSIYNNIEMNIQTATKGEALVFLARHLGIAVQDTMAFGDKSNDLSMIRAAGLGVAMGNADGDLLAAADYITDTNDRNGVAQALERFVLCDNSGTQ